MINHKIIPMRNRNVNIRGRSIINDYMNYSAKPQPKIQGYGVSFESEKIDKLEKEPMSNLQEKLSKIKLK